MGRPRHAKRIDVRVLPGEPTDGTGRVCIHLFVQDPAGKFVEPHALHPVMKDGKVVKQQLEARPTRGRLACDANRDPAPQTRGGVIYVTPRTDDPRAATCPRCVASPEYAAAMAAVGESAVATADAGTTTGE